MRAAWVMAALLFVACGGGADGDEAPREPIEFKPPIIDFEAVATARQTRETTQAQVQAGYQCGWHAGWIETLRAARKDGPVEFRSKAVGRAFGWGGILLLGGLGGTLLLAWSLPRLRRRRAHKEHTEKPSDAVPTWGSYFRGLGLRFVARIGRALRVEQFDPLLANERQRMIETCRDAERQLNVAHGAVAQLGERGAGVATTITTWRSEVTSLRRRLEGAAPLGPELAPDRIAPRIAVILRAARDLRIAIERASISGVTESAWVAIEHELSDRPETPRDRASTPLAALAPWVRTVGLAGLGATLLALPMLACWMAAGAFPLFFALLFGLGGLGAVTLARIHLHRAGRLPLLPGFADRVARWLTTVLALTLLATIISSWMTADGGLDMGDPPHVAMPDPKLLEAPKLFGATPTKPQSMPPTTPP